MAIVYRIEQEKGTSFALWDGLVTADMFLTHARHLISDPNWPAGRGLHLSDVQTAALDASIDDEVLQTAASLFGKNPKISNLKLAIVAQDEFRRATAFERFFSSFPSAIIVFNSVETACIWLGIEPQDAAKTLRSLRAILRGEADS